MAKRDPEIAAMMKVLNLIEPMDDETRARVLAAAASHFGLWEQVMQIAKSRMYA